MNKLKFSERLYGREAEWGILRDAYHRTIAPAGLSELVVVQGSSGSGKSSLVQKLCDYSASVTSSKETHFVSGKFDQTQCNKPYSALSSALTELCELIGSSEQLEQISKAVNEAVGSEAKILTKVVPKLHRIIGRQEDAPATVGSLQALNRFKFVFKALIRAVCLFSGPVVLFLDDLQWADMATVALIKALVTDPDSRNLLLIVSYRDGELDEQMPCLWGLSEIEQIDSTSIIHLDGLEVESINQMISDALNEKPSTTRPLAKVIYQKTNGNIFFVIEILEKLQVDGLLHFSFQTFKWTWELDRIQAETNISDSVIDFLCGKIRSLPADVQNLLKIACCLWSTFDADVLKLLLDMRVHVNACTWTESWEAEEDELKVMNVANVDSSDDLVRLLDKAVNEGLLDKVANTKRYNFVHDRIQQCAYSLIPKGQRRDILHLQIGELMWRMSSYPNGEKWMLFVAADQMNRGSRYVVYQSKRVDLARLNLQVAEEAILLSAFSPALEFLNAGNDLLDDGSQWDQHYNLTLKLSRTLADMEHCVGSFERSKDVIEGILLHAKCLDDRLPSYSTLVAALSLQGNFKEACGVAFDVLSQLGESVPANITSIHVMHSRQKIKQMLRGLTDDDLLSLPETKDDHKIAAMKLLNLLIDCLFHLGNMEGLSVVVYKMMEISLKFGVCQLSGIAYAMYGMGLNSPKGDIREGYRFGRLALKLQEKLASKEWKARVFTYVYVMTNHWQEPLQNSLDPLLAAHATGMEAGDIDYAFQAAGAYQTLYFYSGMTLKPGAQDMKAFCRQMVEYKQQKTLQIYLPLWQCMLNLMGHSQNPLLLTGEAMDQEEFERQFSMSTVWSYRMQLAYYFGDLELAAELSSKLQNLSKSFNAHYLFCARTFFFALISLALAKATKKRKHKRHAHRLMVKMETWVKVGAVNCVHKLLLLKAEYASLGNDTDKVRRAYDFAISTAGRSGFTQDEALANERAGMYFVAKNDLFWASSYLSRSRELYSEWGAQAKVDELQKQHASLLSIGEKIVPSNLRSRPRFKSMISKGHRKVKIRISRPAVNSTKQKQNDRIISP